MDDEEHLPEVVSAEDGGAPLGPASLHSSEPETMIEGVNPVDFYVQEVEAVQTRRRRKKHTKVTVAAAIAVVVVVSYVVIGASGPGSSDAAAQVELGARTTLAAHTAELEVSGSMSANDQSIPITGSGQANLSTGLMDLTSSFSANGTSLSESEVSDGTDVYMQIVGNGKNEVSQFLPGKTWIKVPVESSSTGIGGGSTNILTELQVLTQQGNKVTPLGASTIDGVAVTGYQVTFSPAAMAAAVKRVERQNDISNSMVKTVMQAFEKNPPVIKVWIDAGHLLRREEASISIATATSSASVDMNIDFTNYGTPISVTVPSASEVGSYKAFMTAAQNAS